MSLVGTKVRNFDIVAMLGQGGMGEVYVAFDENLQRKVALKAIRPGRGLTLLARARFLREARILSSLDHPGICRIYDYLEIEGRDYLALELIEGRTLLHAADDLDYNAKLDLAEQLTRVLAAAHAENIVHRDLKPDNVMLSGDGQLKVLDFGLARSMDEGDAAEEVSAPAPTAAPDALDQTITLAAPTPAGGIDSPTMPGSVLGTPLFMSPEQAASEPVSTASDMYSLGLVLQWLFTGQIAYEENEDLEILLVQVGEARTLPVTGIDHDLARLIERLKSRSPSRRPTAVETQERLAWIRNKPTRRNRRLLAAAVMLVMAAAVFKYTVDLRQERAVAEGHRAQAENLIDFMLGDLRDKLTPVGRLDVLDDVGDKALEYYASRRQTELTDEEFFQLSKAMMQIGEVRLAQGNMSAAREAFGEAMAANTDLLVRNPRQTEWLAQLGAIHFWIGNVEYSSGENTQAAGHFARYLDIANELVALEPDNPDWQLEVGYALTNLAAMSEETGDYPRALAYLDRSIAIKRELHQQQPDDVEMLRSLANSLSWSGRARYESGDYRNALSALQESAVWHRRVQESDPKDTLNLQGLAANHFLIATLLEILDRRDEALEHIHQDMRLIRELVVHDPDNADWKSEHAASSLFFGMFWLRQGDTVRGHSQLAEAEAIIGGLLTVNPDQEYWRSIHDALRAAQAHLAGLEGDETRALEILDAAVPPALGRFAASAEPEAARIVGDMLLQRGRLHRNAGRRELADADFKKAAGLLEPLVSQGSGAQLLVVLAQVQAELGHQEQAARTTARLQEMGFARRDFQLFLDDFAPPGG